LENGCLIFFWAAPFRIKLRTSCKWGGRFVDCLSQRRYAVPNRASNVILDRDTADLGEPLVDLQIAAVGREEQDRSAPYRRSVAKQVAGEGRTEDRRRLLAAASRSRPFSKVPIVYITGAAVGRGPSRGVPNSVLLEKPFAPAQLRFGSSFRTKTETSPKMNRPPMLVFA
jgi:hypothetical protein